MSQTIYRKFYITVNTILGWIQSCQRQEQLTICEEAITRLYEEKFKDQVPDGLFIEAQKDLYHAVESKKSCPTFKLAAVLLLLLFFSFPSLLLAQIDTSARPTWEYDTVRATLLITQGDHLMIPFTKSGYIIRQSHPKGSVWYKDPVAYLDDRRRPIKKPYRIWQYQTTD